MSQFGIVEGSTVSTPSGGQKISGEAFRQAALAPGKIAEEIGQDVGGLFQGISNQIQDTRNARKVFDADMAMRDTKDKFLTDIATDPKLASDPNTWVPALQERVKATQDSIVGQKDLAPVVKTHLEKMTGIWGMDTISEVRTQALRKEAADNRDAGIATATRALQDGDLGAATAAYTSLNQLGLMGKKEMEQKISDAPSIVAEAQANTVISTNPINAPKIIQDQLSDKLSPQKLRIITHVAMQAQARAQADNAEGISATIDDNPLHTYDEEALKGARDSGQISVPGYQRIQARMKGYAATATKEVNNQERDEYMVAMLDADTPPTDAKALEFWAKDTKEIGLGWTNPALRVRLNKYVDSKVNAVKKAGEKDERPIENQIYSLMDEDRNHGAAFVPAYNKTDTHFFGPDTTSKVRFGGTLADLRKMTDASAEETFGKGTTARDVIAAEQLNYASKREKMRAWFSSQEQAGKKPTLEDANTYRQKLESADVMKAVAQSFGGKKRNLVLQNGKTYDRDTLEEVK